MNDGKKFPVCAVEKCAAWEGGYCTALTDNNFGVRKCPFFKTREQVAKEKEYCEKRLDEIKKGKQEDDLC